MKYNLESFLKEARAKHQDRYDYSRISEVGSVTDKLEIVCKKHGPFFQSLRKHLMGQNCPTCAGRTKVTTESFKKKAAERWGDAYNYDLVVYEGMHTPVTVVCKKHGQFEVTPTYHLHSGTVASGCTGCNKIRKLSLESFIAEATEKHGGKYDYSQVQAPVMARKTTTVVCPEHGVFYPNVFSHLEGTGCPRCAKNKPYTTEEFIKCATEIHGDKYSYSKSQYTKAQVKTTIFCKTHQIEFEQTPFSHLQGSGCPSCAQNGYRPNLPGNLYILQDGPYLKVGITNRDVKDRVAGLNRSRPTPFSIIKTWHFENGEKALNVETMALSLFRLRFNQQVEKWDGFTETFISDDVNHFISTIESIADSLK